MKYIAAVAGRTAVWNIIPMIAIRAANFSSNFQGTATVRFDCWVHVHIMISHGSRLCISAHGPRCVCDTTTGQGWSAHVPYRGSPLATPSQQPNPLRRGWTILVINQLRMHAPVQHQSVWLAQMPALCLSACLNIRKYICADAYHDQSSQEFARRRLAVLSARPGRPPTTP